MQQNWLKSGEVMMNREDSFSLPSGGNCTFHNYPLCF